METQYELTKTQEFLQRSVRDLARKRIASRVEDIDRAADFPQEVVRMLGENRLLGLLAPKEYGGEGAGFLDFCLMIEELSKVCPTCAVVCTVQNLGCRIIAVNGSEQQKQKYLPQMTTRQALYGFALTEPEPVALDISAAVITATMDGSDYVLNGVKYFIVNGDVADIFGVFAKTDSAQGAGSIRGFLVEKGIPGLSVTKIEGMKGSEARYTCEGVFKDCRVSKESLIGKDGEGMSIILGIIPEVSCSAAARAVGLAQASVDHSAEYAMQRVQFGRPVGQFQAIQSMLAAMAAKTEAARHLLYKAASLVDQKSKDASKFAAMAKYFATDAAMSVTIDAVQIHGGYGYMKDFPIERLMRNAKLTQVTEVNNLIQQVIIAKSLLG